MSPLRSPPSNLDHFPSRAAKRGSRLCRVHRADRGVWWFSANGSGRFDLPPESGYGTCYLAEEPAGCFLEVFRDWILVPEREVEVRRITEIELSAETRLADCTVSRARSHGVTGEIHTTPDYTVTSQWAQAFFEAGFAGIRYFVRHDPGQTLTGIALFGPAGTAAPAGVGEAIRHRITPALIDEVDRRFGIRVLPSP